MAKKSKSLIVPDEVLISKIRLIQGKKVMLDGDLAQLYGVSTFQLNEQVKRNGIRFPTDFMFKLTQEEAFYTLTVGSPGDTEYNNSFLMVNFLLSLPSV